MRRRLTGPVDKALLTLRALKAKVFDQDIIVQEPSKKINDVLKQLGVIMPIKLGLGGVFNKLCQTKNIDLE
jgi:hypothetical protein